MKRTVVDCDACSTKNLTEFHSLEFAVGTQVDSPSGRTETITETLEFCTKCLAKIAQSAISSSSRDEQKIMHNRFVSQQKAAPKSGYPVQAGTWAPAGVVFRDASEMAEREERRRIMVERSGVVPPKK